MKRTLLALLVPLFCFLQNGTAATTVVNDSIPNTGIFLKDRNVYYQKVFTSNLPKEELGDKVAAHLSTMANFKYKHDTYSAPNDFVGYLHNNVFKVSRLVTIFNLPSVLQFPMDAMVIIQVKDNKYRVTVSEMVFKITSTDSVKSVTRKYTLESEITRKGGTEIKPSKQKVIDGISKYFSDLFDLEKSVTATDF